MDREPVVALLLLDFAVSCDIARLSVAHFSAITPQGLAISAEEMSIGSIQENIHILIHLTLSRSHRRAGQRPQHMHYNAHSFSWPATLSLFPCPPIRPLQSSSYRQFHGALPVFFVPEAQQRRDDTGPPDADLVVRLPGSACQTGEHGIISLFRLCTTCKQGFPRCCPTT